MYVANEAFDTVGYLTMYERTIDISQEVISPAGKYSYHSEAK